MGRKPSSTLGTGKLPKGQRTITQFFRKQDSSSNAVDQSNVAPNTPSASATTSTSRSSESTSIRNSGKSSQPSSKVESIPIPGTSRIRESGKYGSIGDEVEYIHGPMPKQRHVLDVINLSSDSDTSPQRSKPPDIANQNDQENEILHSNLVDGGSQLDSVQQSSPDVFVEEKETIFDRDNVQGPTTTLTSSSTSATSISKGLTRRNYAKRKSRKDEDDDEDYLYSSDTDLSQEELVLDVPRSRSKRPSKSTKKNTSKRKKITDDSASDIQFICIVEKPHENPDLPVPNPDMGKLSSSQDTEEQHLPSELDNEISMLVDSALNDDESEEPTRLTTQYLNHPEPDLLAQASNLNSPCPSSSSTATTVGITPPDIISPISTQLTQPIEVDNHHPGTLNYNNSPAKKFGIGEDNSSIQLSPARSPAVSRKSKINSPKAKATYFSPVRHINSPKPSSSKLSPKSSRLSQVTPVSHTSASGPGARNVSVKKSLNFDSNSPVQNPVASSASSFSDIEQNGKPREPYYLETFHLVLNTVPEEHSHLFNESESSLIQSFQSLTTQAKLLYVRLFNRKWEWKQAVTISYPHIADDLSPYFEELHRNSFLLELKDIDISVENLDNVLNVFTSPQLDTLAKQLKLKATKKNKDVFKSAIFEMIQSQRTLHGSSLKAVTKQIFTIVGLTYRISEESKSLFHRMFLLHSPPNYWDDETDQSANLSLLHLLTKTEKMVYPEYKLNKTTHVYQKRDDILRFYEAWKMYSEVQSHVEMKNWVDVKKVAESILLRQAEIFGDQEIINFDISLPNFLRIYTAGSLFTKILSVAVEAFQKTKEFQRANEILEFLLDQNLYFSNYRGRWHERIIINSKHLKDVEINITGKIKRALEDTFVLDAERLDLTERFQKSQQISLKPKKPKTRAKRRRVKNIENNDDNIDGAGESDDETNEVQTSQNLPEEVMLILKHSIKERLIEGEQMSVSSERTFGKSVFLGSGNTSTGNTMHNVESFAIQHYISNEGFLHGLHGEGSVPVSIYGLLFWDVIYDDSIEDSFHSPFQPFPLDFLFPDFYHRRKYFIEEILANLRFHYTVDDIFDLLEINWTNNYGKMSLVNWKMFSGVEQIQDLVLSMGLKIVADICERLAKNFRYYRSGFPDITLWNGSTRKFMFVEVKGPGDQLSKKQKLWLEYLSSIGACVEVCRVKSVSNKRIRN